MKSGNSNEGIKLATRWIPELIEPQWNEACENKLTGYYRWKLHTKHENYAYIFIADMKTEDELEEHWENIIAQIAFHIQSKNDNLLERSNFYVWFFVEEKVTEKLQKIIEDDMYSSQKIVVSGESYMGENERLNLIQRRLFAFSFELKPLDKQMISKVVFQNFRVYEGNKEFDLTNDGQTAQMVAIFAPNGSGKTSFFDGIEWNLTGDIDRLKKIANKDISEEILRNFDSKQNEDAYVQVYLDKDQWVKREVPKLSKRQKTDLKNKKAYFSSKNEIQPYVGNPLRWKNQILQHHKIDGFIAATAPKDNYKEWGELWDVDGEQRKKFEESYKAVKQKRNDYEEVQKEYEEVKKEQLELNENRLFVEKLSEEVNRLYELTDEKIEVQFATMNSQEYTSWINEMDRKREYYRAEYEQVVDKLQYVQLELEGDIQRIYIMQSEQKELSVELKKTQGDIKNCIKKRETELKLKELETQILSNIVQLEGFCFLEQKGEAWYQKVSKYFETIDVLEEKKKDLEEVAKRIQDFEKEKEKLIILQIEKKKDIEEEPTYKRICSHYETIKELESTKNELIEEMDILIKQIRNLESVIEKKRLKKEDIQDKYINSFEEALQKYSLGEFHIDDENEQQSQFKYKMVEEIKVYLNYMKEIDRINKKLYVQENVNKEVKDIITQSRKIIHAHQLKECPVCNTSFGNTEVLLKKTYHSKTESEEKLRNDCIELSNKIEATRKQVEEQVDLYNAVLLGLLSDYEEFIHKCNREYQELLKKKEEILVQKDSIDKEIKEIKDTDVQEGNYVIYTKDGIESWHRLWKTKQNAELTEIENKIIENKQKLKRSNDEIMMREHFIQQRQRYVEQVESEEKEFLYKTEKWKSLMEKKSYKEIIEERNYLEANVKREKQEVIECKEELRNYEDVQLSMEPALIERKNFLLSECKHVEEKLRNYRNNIFKVMNGEDKFAQELQIDNGTKENIEQFLSCRKNYLQTVLEVLDKLKYNRDIDNYFIKWKEVEQKLDKLEQTKKICEKQKTLSENNYQDEKQKIEQQMQKFMQEFQINSIYEKLEPHQKLKELEAEFNINDKEQPELSFKVKGSEGKTYLPEWFFSTAQLNVVAFSVFLGRALMDEDVPLKTIFIDDPVGHFDDMNIVEFVDLLRNIIDNTDRQLIISTHEERVFDLIKRKIPSEEYSARYIDFRESGL